METAEPQATEICATCGRPLTQSGPHWKCLRCLFNWGFLPEGEESDQGPAAHRRVTAEPLKYAHFEVEVGADGFPVALGAGAMAITYRARDTVLNSVVALKVIDRKVAENPAARLRFLREARAAARLHHPNPELHDESGDSQRAGNGKGSARSHAINQKADAVAIVRAACSSERLI